MSQATTSNHLNNNNPASSTEITDPLSGLPTSRRRDGYQPPEGTPLEALFKPDMQSLTNYNLALAHQRANASFDTYLGENNVDAGVELFTKVRHEGPIEAISLAFCFTIRAALTLDLVGSVHLIAIEGREGVRARARDRHLKFNHSRYISTLNSIIVLLVPVW